MPARGSVFLISSLSDNIVFYLFLNSGIIRCAMYSSYLDNSTLLTCQEPVRTLFSTGVSAQRNDRNIPAVAFEWKGAGAEFELTCFPPSSINLLLIIT